MGLYVFAKYLIIRITVIEKLLRDNGNYRIDYSNIECKRHFEQFLPVYIVTRSQNRSRVDLNLIKVYDDIRKLVSIEFENEIMKSEFINKYIKFE